MILFKTAKDLSLLLQEKISEPDSIGFVPTMGAIHKGHTSLVEACKKDGCFTVCSIFVNPTQFNNSTDLQRYPVTLEKDIDALVQAGCDVVFLPSVAEMYPPGYRPAAYNLGDLEFILEGRHRPGHFQGVCQAVDRLLQIVNPHRLYVGQKDYQQCKVIERLLHLTGRTNVELIVNTTLREPDGLAMSSRNLRLTGAQRQMAPLLFVSLQELKNNLSIYPLQQLTEKAKASLVSAGFNVDYIEVVDADTLLTSSAPSDKLIAVVAAWLNDIRLIDNLPLN